jgi:hypothetical protein
MMTIVGMSPRNLPIVPPMKRRGEKAATVVKTAKMTGMPTRCVPRMEASKGSPVPSCSAYTFSPTTMASSTTMPMERMKPKRDRRLIDTSRYCMRMNVPVNDKKMPTEVQKASRGARKRVSVRTTRNSPKMPFSINRLSRLRRLSAWFCQMAA